MSIMQGCSNMGCDNPNKSSCFYQIKEGYKVGEHDWSSLAGSVLCQACHGMFMKEGTLERAAVKRLEADSKRCTYAHCDNPDKSPHFYQVSESTTAGGQDWSALAGSVLCTACYERFRTRGTLERGAARRLAADERRCTYASCRNPDKSHSFHQIREGCTSGGQDWSSLTGSVLCNACYLSFTSRGTLERYSQPSIPVTKKECTYAGCRMPRKSNRFFQIDEGMTSGGQDWSSLAGNVLCNACFQRFQNKGTLERTALQGNQKRCSYDKCDKPTGSCHYVQVDECSKAGGQDWSSLAGRVLCVACYCRYMSRGTLKKIRDALDKWVEKSFNDDIRCTYADCQRPNKGSRFYPIEEDCIAGDQDWSSLVGNVLCRACYERYKMNGTLEMSKKVPGMQSSKACKRKAKPHDDDERKGGRPLLPD